MQQQLKSCSAPQWRVGTHRYEQSYSGVGGQTAVQSAGAEMGQGQFQKVNQTHWAEAQGGQGQEAGGSAREGTGGDPEHKGTSGYGDRGRRAAARSKAEVHGKQVI